MHRTKFTCAKKPEKGNDMAHNYLVLNEENEDEDFKTSSLSRWPLNVGNKCVKVKRTPDAVLVQDSKLGENSPTLSFTLEEWDAFLGGAKNGEFDL